MYVRGSKDRSQVRDWLVVLVIVDVFPGARREISSLQEKGVLSSSKPCYDEDGVDFPREHTSVECLRAIDSARFACWLAAAAKLRPHATFSAEPSAAKQPIKFTW